MHPKKTGKVESYAQSDRSSVKLWKKYEQSWITATVLWLNAVNNTDKQPRLKRTEKMSVTGRFF
jgi:hypothetical protein